MPNFFDAQKTDIAYIPQEEESNKPLKKLQALLMKHIKLYVDKDNGGAEGLERVKIYIPAIHDKSITTESQLLEKVYNDFINLEGFLGSSKALRGRIGNALCEYYKITDQQISTQMVKMFQHTGPRIGAGSDLMRIQHVQVLVQIAHSKKATELATFQP